MITRDDKLEVFENFREDETLPKFRQENDASDSFDEDSDGPRMKNSWSSRQRAVLNLSDESSEGTSIQLVPFDIVETKPRGFLSRLAFWRREAKKPPQAPSISVLEFFSHIKNSTQELETVEARATGYERAITNAVQAGQHALVEQLQAGLNAYAMETQLVSLGMTRFVTEETVVTFYKQSKKGLRLDWVRNFTRTIPEAIIAKKQRADELGLFDNYAVLHYDPRAKSYAETQEEKAARKDPILFGLMKGRRTLYVVGDWVDETCDLTLDQIAEQLGTGAVGSFENPKQLNR